MPIVRINQRLQHAVHERPHITTDIIGNFVRIGIVLRLHLSSIRRFQGVPKNQTWAGLEHFSNNDNSGNLEKFRANRVADSYITAIFFDSELRLSLTCDMPMACHQ